MAELEEAKVKVVETVVFIPATPESKLRKTLQELDRNICRITNSPKVWFVDRGGPTVMETMGRTNPGAKD